MEICTEEKKRNAVVLVVLKVKVNVFRHEDDRFLHDSGCVWTVYKTYWSIESSTSASNSSFATKKLTLLQWSPQFKQRNEQNKPTFVQSYFPLQFVLHLQSFIFLHRNLYSAFVLADLGGVMLLLVLFQPHAIRCFYRYNVFIFFRSVAHLFHSTSAAS